MLFDFWLRSTDRRHVFVDADLMGMVLEFIARDQ